MKKNLLPLPLSLCVLLAAGCGKSGQDHDHVGEGNTPKSGGKGIEGTWKPDTSGLEGEKKKEADKWAPWSSMALEQVPLAKRGHPVSFHMEDRW